MTSRPKRSSTACRRARARLVAASWRRRRFLLRGGRLARERKLDLDALILATHGGPGEDGTLQGALDLAGIDYSGPSLAGAAIGMDKWAFSSLIAQAGLPTLAARALDRARRQSLPFDGPYILKPRFGGSSIGIDVVADFATARARLTREPALRQWLCRRALPRGSHRRADRAAHVPDPRSLRDRATPTDAPR